jgi:hypothetical protein
MAAAGRVQGVSGVIALIERLAPAARDELGELLNTLGGAIQQEQRALAPERTGKLKLAITWQAVVAKLQLRVGLLNKSNGDAYYGRFVHFGRKAQTVLVQRRRRVGGNLRTLNRRKRSEDISATYSLHVRARAASPFVVMDAQTERTVDTALADFWSRALGRAGAA